MAGSPRDIITSELRKLANVPITMDDDGNMETRARVLAKILWIYGLGGVINIIPGEASLTISAPKEWAIKIILDRLEGKALAITEEIGDKPKVVDKIGRLNKQHISQLAEYYTDNSNSVSTTETEAAPEPKPEPEIEPEDDPEPDKPDNNPTFGF